MTESEREKFCERDRFILSDARALKIYCWGARPKPKGILLFAHGMLEHAGRYADWGDEMARRGWTVFAVDHAGHGQSDGEKIWMDHFSDLVDDFCEVTERVSDVFPKTPLFLVGLSMGGGIAIQTAHRLRQTNRLAGLVLLAPALRVHPRLFPWLRPLAILIDRIAPRWRLVKGGTNGLSRNKAMIDDFRADPYVFHGRMPVHYGVENIRALKVNRACAADLSLPILALQGSGDLITDPAGPPEFIQNSPSTDKTLRIYPHLCHELLHEPEKMEVIGDLDKWLEEHLEGGNN